MLHCIVFMLHSDRGLYVMQCNVMVIRVIKSENDYKESLLEASLHGCSTVKILRISNYTDFLKFSKRY